LRPDCQRKTFHGRTVAVTGKDVTDLLIVELDEDDKAPASSIANRPLKV